MQRRRALLALALCLVGGLALWWTQRLGDRPASAVLQAVPPIAPDAGPDASDTAPEAASLPAPSTAPPRATRRAAAYPPTTGAAAPYGCPGEPEADPPGFVRPSTWDLFVVRTMELRDRLPHYRRESSPSMRRGLSSLSTVPDLDALFDAPDRQQDGFDLAMAALFHLATRALSHRSDMAEAHRLALRAVHEAPTDPLAHVLSARVAERTYRHADALAAYARAAELAPDEPAIRLAEALAAVHVGAFQHAADAGAAYLALEPGDVRIRAWQARMQARAETTASFASRRGSGITVLHPVGLPRVQIDGLIATVRNAMDETAQLVNIDRRPELAVVVYPTVEIMRAATCAPSWSGGVFDGVLHLAARTVAANDTRTLRHEATHAQLRLVNGRIPTWLNEGLAQHMEGPADRGTRASWERMTANRIWIPFASLEGQLVVIDDAGDAGLAYHQSLAMVRWLLDTRGVRVLREAMARIERRQNEDLLEQLVPGADGDAMLTYLRGVLARPG